MPFVADSLQNVSNGLYNNFGVTTPELGWTEASGGSNVAANHTLNGANTNSFAGNVSGFSSGLGGLTSNLGLPLSGASGGGGSSAASSAAAATAAALAGYNTQKNNIYGTALDAANSLAPTYEQNILETIRNLNQSQSTINNQRIQNEAAKIQGTRDISDMVGRGIRSGGVTLASRNAGNSSATGALANAYGELGRRELSKVGNQFATADAGINTAQEDLTYQLQQAPEKFRVGLMQNVDNIVAQARDQLASLDAAMSSASLTGRIAIDQEKQAIKNQVLGVLDQYNTKLASGVQGIQASGADDIRAKANAQLVAGQAPATAFNYTTEAPAALQGTGPVASELPIYAYNRRTDV